jgi:hypothetical protein
MQNILLGVLLHSWLQLNSFLNDKISYDQF